ncbi:MAG: hypothetical protein EPN97_07210 [Alphaproteobacteria bacterium]|nr:MAG: hypothetical protein EPN97_07210 [Alphaproteobacteria bacterium]
MKLIGVKRTLILAILLAINLAVAAVFFLQVDPMREDSLRKLSTMNSQIAEQSQKIANIKADLETFKATLPKYELLEKKGFTLNQDRFRMSRDLDDVRMKSSLAGFSFTINDIRKIDNADALAAQMQLIDSRIKIENVVSLLDLNFYDFIDIMQWQFPAHVRVQSFDVMRKDPLNSVALGHIAKGEPVNLISATAFFDWLTIVPKLETKSGQSTPGGL